MAYTLLDAAYAMYHPEANFAAGKKGGLIRRSKAAALRGARMARRGAKLAGGFAMRNKGKLALGVGGTLALGAGGVYAAKRFGKKKSKFEVTEHRGVVTPDGIYRTEPPKTVKR